MKIRSLSLSQPATSRVLPTVTRCYKCHDIGHVAARCPVVESGREICRRCGSMDHKMQECSNEPRCTLCIKVNKGTVRHVTGSLACPVARERSKECKLGRRAAVIKFGERTRGSLSKDSRKKIEGDY